MTLRLEPLHAGNGNDEDTDATKAKLKVIEANNKCCSCFGLTARLGLTKKWFIRVSTSMLRPQEYVHSFLHLNQTSSLKCGPFYNLGGNFSENYV